MQYRPGTPEHNDNLSHQKPGREFLSLALVAIAIVLLLLWLMGWAVDWAASNVDAQTERRWLAPVAAALPQQNAPFDQRRTALENILQPLLRCVDQPEAVELRVIEDDTANAFAVPGGQMWVSTGLLDSGLSENGLAFVLAHELGHFANRDHLRGLGRGLVLWVGSATLLGADSPLSQLLSPSVAWGQAQFSQQREGEADALGLAVLQCAYGHVGGATEFFALMQKTHPEGLPGSHYFDSHPQLSVRIADLERRAAQRSWRFEATRPMPAHGR